MLCSSLHCRHLPCLICRLAQFSRGKHLKEVSSLSRPVMWSITIRLGVATRRNSRNPDVRRSLERRCSHTIRHYYPHATDDDPVTVIYFEAIPFHRADVFRYRQDVEVVGQIVMIASRLV
jgi:hypothetical protein